MNYEMNDGSYFRCQKIIKTNEFYWMISSTTNAIWKCDLNFKVVDYFIFEKENAIQDLFRAIVIVDEIIYLFPFNASRAYSFDTKTAISTELDIDGLSNVQGDAKYAYAFVKDNLIIAVGRSIGGFLKYNISTKSSKLVTNGWAFNKEYICSFSHGLIGNCVYTVSVMEPILVEFDFVEEKIKQYDLSKVCDSYLNTIMSDDGAILVTNDRSEVLVFDEKINCIEVREIDKWNDTRIRLSGIYKNEFWYIGNSQGHLMIEGKKLYELSTGADSLYCFTAVEQFGDTLLIQERKNHKLIIFNLNNCNVNRCDVSINDEIEKKYMAELMKIVCGRSQLIREDINTNLERFIEFI